MTPNDPATPPVRLGIPASVWLTIAAFCALIEIAGTLANEIRPPHWTDLVFTIAFGLVGAFALLNAMWLLAESIGRRKFKI